MQLTVLYGAPPAMGRVEAVDRCLANNVDEVICDLAAIGAI